MSYDIYLTDDNGEVLELALPHAMGGGTYAVGGTRECWLNVTYNYYKHFKRVFGEKGIRLIYGITGKNSIPILKAAISKLGNDRSNNYWEPTEGNAKMALENLLTLAELRPDGTWKGD